MGHRIFRGHPQYYVSLVGYDAFETAWLVKE